MEENKTADYNCAGCGRPITGGQVIVDQDLIYTKSPVLLHIRLDSSILVEQSDTSSCLWRYMIKSDKLLFSDVMPFSEFEERVRKHAAETQR